MKNIIRLLYGLVLAGGTLLFATACSDDTPNINLGGGDTAPGVPATGNVAARMETPAIKTSGTLVTAHRTKEGADSVMTYSLEFDRKQLHSRWVAFRFGGRTRIKNVSRSDEPFADDPMLPTALRIGPRSFGNPYNRGHICASADRLYSAKANEQTFYMSNMSPQLASFNQGYWITLEGQVQKLGRDASFADTLYVVKGGTVEPHQILGYVNRTDSKRVAVPHYYFMALLKVKNGTYTAIGFWMEHKEYGYNYKQPAPLAVIGTHAVSIDELERLTGIDFFPNLPDKVENAVEATAQKTAWGFPAG